MIKIAILGFGTVGGGSAELIAKNKNIIEQTSGQAVEVARILDLRSFPDSPYADIITNDFNEIVNDPEIYAVLELMGGSHPAYEYSIAAMEAGKHVITSNKEVVANYGDKLLDCAFRNGVRYRFEASVGGGIPIISPITSDLSHNAIKEISGILNGTTNYILTRMFTYGDSFETALEDARSKGYTEKDPSADIDGIDVCRKITILSALMTGSLINTDRVHTEGISSIRLEDVQAASRMGASVKLLGRSVRNKNGDLFVMVAPFIVPSTSPLSCVNDVFNAVCVTGDPVGQVMFYGRGAGADATASAVIADLCAIIRERDHTALPMLWKSADDSLPSDFGFFVCRNYIALSGVDENAVNVVFGDVEYIEKCDSELKFMTSRMTERDIENNIKRLCAFGAEMRSRIRIYE